METFLNIPFENKKIKGNIFTIGFLDIKESFIFMFKKRPTLWKSSLIYASLNFFLTSLTLIAVPVLITKYLGFTTNTANRLYGYAQGVIAAGAILGGIISGVLSKKLKPKSSIFILIACALLISLSTIFQIQLMSYLQILTPKDLIGKVVSCFVCVSMCTTPLGQFIYGIIFDKIGNKIYLLFYLASFIMLLISIFTRHIFYKFDLLIKSNVTEKENYTLKYINSYNIFGNNYF